MKQTPWAEFLLSAVKNHFHHQDVQNAVIVDLGAGPTAVIARQLQQSFPQFDYVAVEPYGEVDAPSNMKVFSSMDQVAVAPDYVLFNPPSLPSDWIDPQSPQRFAWNGGPTGAEVIRSAMAEAFAAIKRGGKYIFLCASFHHFKVPDDASVEVLDYRYDPAETLAGRAPLALTPLAAARRLQDMAENSSHFWRHHGVLPRAGAYAMCAVALTKI